MTGCMFSSWGLVSASHAGPRELYQALLPLSPQYPSLFKHPEDSTALFPNNMAATTPEKALQEEVKEYQYFQPELIEIIASENIYDEDRQQPWEVNE